MAKVKEQAIAYSTNPAAGNVTLKVYDISGREIATLLNGNFQAGSHSVTWDAREVPSGVYLCRLIAGEFNETRKLILLK